VPLASDATRVRTEPPGALVFDGGGHGACVDAWLLRTATGLSAPALRRLLEAALGALWTRTQQTLGEVTLTAIVERVLYTATEKYPFLSPFKVGPSRGIVWGGSTDGPPPPLEAELTAGMRFLLVEFLSVLGNLTAEILTVELHVELMSVALPQAVHLVKEPEGSLASHRSRRSGEGGGG
jgi:hypothetical protein